MVIAPLVRHGVLPGFLLRRERVSSRRCPIPVPRKYWAPWSPDAFCYAIPRAAWTRFRFLCALIP